MLFSHRWSKYYMHGYQVYILVLRVCPVKLGLREYTRNIFNMIYIGAYEQNNFIEWSFYFFLLLASESVRVTHTVWGVQIIMYIQETFAESWGQFQNGVIYQHLFRIKWDIFCRTAARLIFIDPSRFAWQNGQMNFYQVRYIKFAKNICVFWKS